MILLLFLESPVVVIVDVVLYIPAILLFSRLVLKKISPLSQVSTAHSTQCVMTGSEFSKMLTLFSVLL